MIFEALSIPPHRSQTSGGVFSSDPEISVGSVSQIIFLFGHFKKFRIRSSRIGFGADDLWSCPIKAILGGKTSASI
jgi:hypothetical protein